MSYASDDLVPLLGQTPGKGIGFRQGVVHEWNQQTAENTIRVAGTNMTNLPILNTNEALLLQPGDVVGIMTAGSSWFIIGRITIPGTPAAATALDMVSGGITSGVDPSGGSTNSTSFTDLSGTNVGPTVRATVGSSGKAIITLTAYMEAAAGGLALMGVQVAGPTNVAPTQVQSLSLGGGSSSQLISMSGRSSVQVLFEGLQPGTYTFTAKYSVTMGTSWFYNRSVMVQPY